MDSKKDGFKSFFKKFWFLLWKDNSLKGWIFSIVFLLLFIKFIFFPFLSLITGTSLPLAIVESCSMYHKGGLFSDFDSWWESHEEKYSELGISKSDFENFALRNGFNKGDILLIVRANPEKIKQGDIIIFNANQQNPIIHRVIEIKDINERKFFSTLGDNNNGQLPFEKDVTEEKVIGRSVLKLAPYAGWIKLVFYDWQKPTEEKGFCNEN